MASKQIIKSCIVAATIVIGSMSQPAFALPPAAGGGYQETEACDIWMAAVRNLRYTFGFTF